MPTKKTSAKSKTTKGDKEPKAKEEEQIAKTTPKNHEKKTSPIAGMAVVVVIILVVVATLFMWQKISSEKKQNELQSKLDDIETKTNQIENLANALSQEKTNLENKLEETDEKIEKTKLEIEENKLKEDRETNKTAVLRSLCTEAPVTTEAGMAVYPIHPKYKGLNYLAQLFTASGCNPERVAALPSTNEENQFTLGSEVHLFSNVNPSVELIQTFNDIGFKCNEDSLDATCKTWKLESVMDVEKLLLLEPYYESLKSDECVNCS